MIKRIIYAISGVLLIAAFTSCTPKSETNMTSDSTVKDAINKQNEVFMTSFQESDTTQFAQVYLQDGWMMPPDSPPIKGRQGIKQFLLGAHKMGLSKIMLTTGEVSVHGDAAVETGTYQTFAGDQQVGNGSYMVYWKKDGNTWRMARDIWNSDTPPPSQSDS